jgi:hypothetical protein
MSKLEIHRSVVAQAKANDHPSIQQMFKPFIGEDETILSEAYLGKYGIIFATHSFVCLTDKKICSIQYGPFGQIVYSDAFIEEVNSGVIYQPSVFKLYLIGTILCLTLVGVLLLNAWVKLYYTFNKSGMVWCVKQGVNIYVFANRSKINLINEIWRRASSARGRRKASLR